MKELCEYYEDQMNHEILVAMFFLISKGDASSGELQMLRRFQPPPFLKGD